MATAEKCVHLFAVAQHLDGSRSAPARTAIDRRVIDLDLVARPHSARRTDYPDDLRRNLDLADDLEVEECAAVRLGQAAVNVGRRDLDVQNFRRVPLQLLVNERRKLGQSTYCSDEQNERKRQKALFHKPLVGARGSAPGTLV